VEALVKRVFLLIGLAAACARGPRIDAVTPPDGALHAADPVVVRDVATGDLLLAWVGGEGEGDNTTHHLYTARSGDLATWSPPAQVTRRDGDVHPHAESSPRWIAASGVLGLAWTNSIPVPGRQWPASNIRFARSEDGGWTWSAPITLNDDTARGPSGHIFHGAAWSGDSSVLVAWMDERRAPSHAGHVESRGPHQAEAEQGEGEPDATVYLARSNNWGRTWRPNRALWGAACPCCRVSLARGPEGQVTAAWRKHFPGNVRDIVVANVAADTNPDAGQLVHQDDWVYPGCPHTGPGASIDGAGATHVAWYTGKPGATGILYARRGRTQPSGAGAAVRLISGPRIPTAHPAVAAFADGRAIVAWDMSARGRPELQLALVGQDGTVRWQGVVAGSAGADHPSVAVLDDSTAVVAWAQQEGAASRVRMVKVTVQE
jgi:hypothetical protein